jgi:hypothetical protein
MNARVIVDGISLGPGRCAAVLKSGAAENDDSDSRSWLIRWELGGAAQLFELDFVASALAEFGDALFVLGRLGPVARFLGESRSDEIVEGPEDLGFLTDMRDAGGVLMAVGMWRQVYVRSEGGIWSGPDQGILDPVQDVDRVTGLRSILQTTASTIVVVGLEGEIWVKDGKWHQEPSPTNVILEQMCVDESGEIVVVGQQGTILRGRPGAWRVDEQVTITDDLWGAAMFKGRTYVATSDGIFRIEPTGVEQAQVLATGQTPKSKLRAAHGALWSFGWDGCCWTEDGMLWHKADLLTSVLSP